MKKLFPILILIIAMAFLSGCINKDESLTETSIEVFVNQDFADQKSNMSIESENESILESAYIPPQATEQITEYDDEKFINWTVKAYYVINYNYEILESNRTYRDYTITENNARYLKEEIAGLRNEHKNFIISDEISPIYEQFGLTLKDAEKSANELEISCGQIHDGYYSGGFERFDEALIELEYAIQILQLQKDIITKGLYKNQTN